MRVLSILVFAALFSACATNATAERVKKPVSYFVPKAEALADEQLIQDEHIYAGIALLGSVPPNAAFQADQSDPHIQQFKVDDVAPFSFALLEVSDDVVVGIILYYITEESTEARNMFNASQKKMYQKYSKSDNIAIDHDGMAMWSFLTREKWVEYRAADMERRYNMPRFFGRQKQMNTGIDNVLNRAAVSLLEPTKEMPFHTVAISYDSHLKTNAKAEQRQELEDSLDL